MHLVTVSLHSPQPDIPCGYLAEQATSNNEMHRSNERGTIHTDRLHHVYTHTRHYERQLASCLPSLGDGRVRLKQTSNLDTACRRTLLRLRVNASYASNGNVYMFIQNKPKSTRHRPWITLCASLGGCRSGANRGQEPHHPQ